MAKLMRMGWFRGVHVKAPVVQEIRALLTARKLLVAKLRDVESSLRGLLCGFGLKVGAIGKGTSEARIRELVAGQGLLEWVAEPLLRARASLCSECAAAPRAPQNRTRGRGMRSPDDPPGCGGGGGDDVPLRRRPARAFRQIQGGGCSLGLTYQSGEIDRTDRISKVGDAMVRTALFEAANAMLTRAVRLSALKAWALRVASRQGTKKAKVALAHKLTVVMHRMWLDGHGVLLGQASHAGGRGLRFTGRQEAPARRSHREDAWIGQSRNPGVAGAPEPDHAS